MRWNVLVGFAFSFVFVGLPAVGIILAESTLWNVVWWAVYLSLCYWWVQKEAASPLPGRAIIATVNAQVPLVILFELGVTSQIAWWVALTWATIAYRTAYVSRGRLQPR